MNCKISFIISIIIVIIIIIIYILKCVFFIETRSI